MCKTGHQFGQMTSHDSAKDACLEESWRRLPGYPFVRTGLGKAHRNIHLGTELERGKRFSRYMV